MSEFGEIYERHSKDVFRFALYLSGNRAEAEDITSETFVRAWTAPGRIEAATLKGYLFTIARHLYLRSLRRRAREVALDNALSETLRDPLAGPYTAVEQGAELARVMAALQRLPEPDRAALIMRAMDELPYDEIALALGITPVSARVKVHRARLALLEVKHEGAT